MTQLPELLLPAGSFESALAAIEGGADALYFGFGDFSARKQARNLDRLEYRRLLRHAQGRKVKLYVTINTIILERELEKLCALLVFLSRFPPDAVIVQDWGLARLIHERFPAFCLHGSTQMAIQTPEAARLAADLGLRRIVLPRECSLADLRRFSRELPEMEFEVFVHGALCYSFSGLCLASGHLLGRSGNRGECAQVCRSYYTMEAQTADGKGGARGSAYWFSCRDLSLADRVGELAAAGAASLKVEGRMKAPEYGYAVARYYRALLDRLAGNDIPAEDLAARSEAARIAFARLPTEAWFASRGGERLIDQSFPGHRGAVAGSIIARRGSRIIVELSTSLGLRDGVLLFEEGDQSRPLPFSVTGLRDASTGRELAIARAGSRVEIDCPGSPKPGTELRRISARELDLRSPSPEEYPPARQDVDAGLLFPAGALGLDLRTPLFPGDTRSPLRAEAGDQLPFQVARKAGSFTEALTAVFDESGETDFRLHPLVEEGASFPLGTGSESTSVPIPDLFLPPSVLKREKNRLYRAADGELAKRFALVASEAASSKSLDPAPHAGSASAVSAPLRSSLVFPLPELPAGLPFATPRLLREHAKLPRAAERSWLPLAPLVADVGAYEALVRDRIAETIDAGEQIVVGLDSVHHLAFSRRLVEEFAPRDPAAALLGFYLDIHLYVANSFALATFASLPWLSGRLLFAYFYLEAGGEELAELREALAGRWPELAQVDRAFEPPLFLSSGCLRKHDEEGGACPPACDRHWTRRLKDRERGYVAIVDDCVSMLFRASTKG